MHLKDVFESLLYGIRGRVHFSTLELCRWSRMFRSKTMALVLMTAILQRLADWMMTFELQQGARGSADYRGYLHSKKSPNQASIVTAVEHFENEILITPSRPMVFEALARVNRVNLKTLGQRYIYVDFTKSSGRNGGSPVRS